MLRLSLLNEDSQGPNGAFRAYLATVLRTNSIRPPSENLGRAANPRSKTTVCAVTRGNIAELATRGSTRPCDQGQGGGGLSLRWPVRKAQEAHGGVGYLLRYAQGRQSRGVPKRRSQDKIGAIGPHAVPRRPFRVSADHGVGATTWWSTGNHAPRPGAFTARSGVSTSLARSIGVSPSTMNIVRSPLLVNTLFPINSFRKAPNRTAAAFKNLRQRSNLAPAGL
jgi:hypothetical protein